MSSLGRGTFLDGLAIVGFLVLLFGGIWFFTPAPHSGSPASRRGGAGPGRVSPTGTRNSSSGPGPGRTSLRIRVNIFSAAK